MIRNAYSLKLHPRNSVRTVDLNLKINVHVFIRKKLQAKITLLRKIAWNPFKTVLLV